MKNLATWQFIEKNLAQKKGVLLLYVLESEGSSPGRQGFMMAINANGEMCGSVGGGIMEHKMVELGKQLLLQSATDFVIKQQIHSKAAAQNQSGMICSGRQTLLLKPLQNSDLSIVKNIVATLTQEKQRTITISPQGIHLHENYTIPTTYQFVYENDQAWQYAERLGERNELFVVGGGHCALAFCKLMTMLDFRVHLFEDRPHLNTFAQNKYAHSKTVVSAYENLADYIPSGARNFVVLMTFGYRTDAIALRALLGQQFAYLGMLGSGAKIAQLFDDLRQEGVVESVLQNIYAPIGLPIKSQTPEEIAVSIAAQIIAVKNEGIL